MYLPINKQNFLNSSQTTCTLRPAGPLEVGGLTANAAALLEPSQPDNSVSADDISVLELLAFRGTNLQSKQQPPLTSIENVTAPREPEPMVTGAVIVHIKPYVDNALPSQDTTQGTS